MEAPESGWSKVDDYLGSRLLNHLIPTNMILTISHTAAMLDCTFSGPSTLNQDVFSCPRKLFTLNRLKTDPGEPNRSKSNVYLYRDCNWFQNLMILHLCEEKAI